MLITLLVISSTTIDVIECSGLFSSSHRNTRCLCKCPDVDIVKKDSNDAKDWIELRQFRSIYIEPSIESPKDCDCPHVVLDKLWDESRLETVEST